MINIERRFSIITGNTLDLSKFPITEISGFERREELVKSHHEVFTPLYLVDEMVSLSPANPNKTSLDLCAGRGQFTIRILRRLYNTFPDFDLNQYIKNNHWFNEINEDSCRELIEIFGNDINLAIGPAEELKNYPEDSKGIWKKGIWKWNDKEKKWLEVDLGLKYKSYKSKKSIVLF